MVERSDEDTTIRYYYDGQQILSEAWVDPDGTIREKVSYLRGNSLAMLETATGEKGYYMVNGHGDVTGITDTAGELINEYTYDIWGKPLEHSETIEQSFRYSGEYWDEETNLQYLRARWYDPSIGRFINEDTYEGELSNPLSLNLYTYVHNNPLRYIDPSGNYCVSQDGKWAHSGSCKSDSSVYLGDDDTYYGSPTIEKGVITGYVGKSGPFQKKEYNFWEETTNGLVTGTADAVLGNALSNQLLKSKPLYSKLPGLGPAAGGSGVRFPSETSKLLAGVSKMAGPVTVVLTGVEVYKDFEKYSGKDRWYASAMTVTGTVGTVVIVAGISAVGTPIVLAIGAGAAIGAGVNIGVNC
ncbi:RHS repeat-associated core domain-containing protein [Paenibacillus yanchengensis]|uniref:RHS repeat-associated core domain-containing protein n=1 Tax=Paenibacillus yanchengensis TaxID=2035833 RepID=A0ABW4YI19_9BACL